jgi:hypothetical protein
MKKWLVLIGLVLSSGGVLAERDVIIHRSTCQEDPKNCGEIVFVRQESIFKNILELKTGVENIKNSSIELVKYKNKECNSWSNKEAIEIHKEQYIGLKSLYRALAYCVSPIKISKLADSEIAFAEFKIKIPEIKEYSYAQSLIYNMIGSPLCILDQVENQTFNKACGWMGIPSRYKYFAGNLISDSIYIIVKNSTTDSNSLAIVISETDRFGKMSFDLDTAISNFKPSFKGFDKFDSTSAVMIRLTGRLDRNIFDFDHPPKLTTLKGTPIAR